MSTSQSPSISPINRSQSYHDLSLLLGNPSSPNSLDMWAQEFSQDLASSGTLILSQDSILSDTEFLSQTTSPPRKRPRLQRLNANPELQTIIDQLQNPSPRDPSQPPLVLDLTPKAQDAPTGNSKFRFRATSVFCTWPQCATPKEQVLANILKRWGENVLFAVVSEEKHKDGTPHLHAVVKFKKQISSSNARFADDLSGSHGKYESAKNIKKVLRYVMKDGCYLVHGDVPVCDTSSDLKKVSVFDEICSKILDGVLLRDIRAQYPKQFMLYRNRIMEYYADIRTEREYSELLPWPGVDPSPFAGIGEDSDRRLFEMNTWFAENIRQDRPFKSPQLFIHGPTNIGKTSLIISLRKYLSIYMVPMMENWYNGYDDDLYDLIVLDEFKGQKPLTYMNLFLDGSYVSLPVKGSMVTKKKNLPVVILSNFSPEDCYKNLMETDPSTLDTFLSRITVIDFSCYDSEVFKLKINFVSS